MARYIHLSLVTEHVFTRAKHNQFMNIKISLFRIVFITKKRKQRSSASGTARTLPAVHRIPVLATGNTTHHTAPARVGHRTALLRERICARTVHAWKAADAASTSLVTSSTELLRERTALPELRALPVNDVD